MDVEPIITQAYARAGLLGNPSDGYNGKTISLIVKNYSATVTLIPSEKLEVVPSDEEVNRFDSLHDFAATIQRQGYYGGVRLIKAALKRFFDYGFPRGMIDDRAFTLRYSSKIPRQVGLAGSSAIIVATMRALEKFYGVEIPLNILPSLVLSVEANELGIPAGLQDRVIQCYQGVVFMDFGKAVVQEQDGMEIGQYEPLSTDWTPDLFIAFAHNVGEPTEVLHNDLKRRFDAGDREVHQAIETFAELAQQGRVAWDERDSVTLSKLINRNFDLRAKICPLLREHVAMIDTARRHDASAKYCGSGGAIIGIVGESTAWQKMTEDFRQIGCTVIRPTIE